MSELGIVAIGRNEGERLRCCLDSVLGRGLTVVYVDGNSTDGSVELARSLGAEVVVEDPSRPGCASNARNAGFERVCQLDPGVRFVQFIDSDCEVVAGWFDRALEVFAGRPDVAIVTGRRRERHPERSWYNRLADIDWDGPIGEIRGSHGDFMIRVEAFRQVGGFDTTIPVSEDHELCLRLRREGWILLRIAEEMTRHDMAMTRFSQWWRRCIRTGYGYAQGAFLHGRSPERHNVRNVRSGVLWGIALPAVILATLILGLAWPSRDVGRLSALAGLLLTAAYPLQIARIALRHHRAGMTWDTAWLYGAACTVGHLGHAVGLLSFWTEQLLKQKKTERVITYK